MAYTNKQVTGGVAIAVAAIAGGVALGIKAKKMWKARALKKTQVPVDVGGEKPQEVQALTEAVELPVMVEKTAPLEAQA